MTEQPENLADTRANPARQKPEIMSPAGYWPQLHAAAAGLAQIAAAGSDL